VRGQRRAATGPIAKTGNSHALVCSSSLLFGMVTTSLPKQTALWTAN